MSFRPRWAPQAQRTFEELQAAAERAASKRERSSKAARGKMKTKSSKQEGLFKQVAKTVQLLVENPRHPGLNTHEYHSLPHPYQNDAKVFEAYAQHKTPGAYRVFWCYGPEEGDITLIAITPHP